jgi:hypothetical protein
MRFVANEQLRREMESTAVYQSGVMHFGRPDLEYIIENHTFNLIAARRSSCSVLTFSVSPELLLSIQQHQIPSDMLTVITGNKSHQMEHMSECYGGVKTSKPRQQPMKAAGSSKRKAASIVGKPWNEGNGLVKKEGGFHSREAVE